MMLAGGVALLQAGRWPDTGAVDYLFILLNITPGFKKVAEGFFARMSVRLVFLTPIMTGCAAAWRRDQNRPVQYLA